MWTGTNSATLKAIASPRWPCLHYSKVTWLGKLRLFQWSVGEGLLMRSPLSPKDQITTKDFLWIAFPFAALICTSPDRCLFSRHVPLLNADQVSLTTSLCLCLVMEYCIYRAIIVVLTIGLSNPFAPLSSWCQCRSSRVFLPLVFFSISMHFTALSKILPASALGFRCAPEKPHTSLGLHFRDCSDNGSKSV